MRTVKHVHASDSQVPERTGARSGRLLFPQTVAIATVLVAIAACSDTATGPRPGSPASATASPTEPPSRYAITEIGTLGGGFSIAFNVNNAGGVSGAANTLDEYQHAFYWDQGQMTDLGTLGGLNSQAAGGAPGRAIAILSETAEIDPLQENFCGFGTGLVCAAGIWRQGTLSRLPTLGGVNAAALTYNVGGQVVGVADDGTLDASCIAPQKSHFQAVTWSPEGAIQKLPPLPGDEVGIALRGNDNGQVAGTSGLCANTQFGGFAIGPHAVLWDHGSPIDLGTLGGSGVGVAASVNNRGQVIGAASSPDGTPHPFLWTGATGMRDLGLMSADPADANNTPFQINDRGQMVGASCDATLSTCRGYLWQNGVMTDINDLLPADSPLYVILPESIDESGQIAGLAVVLSTGEVHAFVATPSGGGAGAHSTAHKVLLPERARATLRRVFGGPRR